MSKNGKPSTGISIMHLLEVAISYSLYWHEQTRLDVWAYTRSRLKEFHNLVGAIEAFLASTGAQLPPGIAAAIARIFESAKSGDYTSIFNSISLLEHSLRVSYNRALASQWILASARVTVSLAGIITLLMLLVSSRDIMDAFLYIASLGLVLSSLLAFKNPVYTSLLVAASILVSLSVFYTQSLVGLITALYLLVSALALQEVGGVLADWTIRPVQSPR